MPKITEFYVYIIEFTPGNETVPSIIDESQGFIHMATDRAETADGLKQRAIDIVRDTGHPMKLVRFTNIEVLEVFGEKH